MLIKVLIGAMLVATTTVAQTAQQPTQQSTNQAGTAQRPSGSTESTTRSNAKASKAPVRRLPQPSLKEKLQTKNTNNPNYQREKSGQSGSKREYAPRRTASGARKDTLLERRKSQNQ